MGSEEWRVESGEWKVDIGECREWIESGKWRDQSIDTKNIPR